MMNPDDAAGVVPGGAETPVGDQAVSRRTWAAVCTVLLLAACVYTATGIRLEFMTTDSRPGPGFFPRIVGVSLIISTVYVLSTNWKRFGAKRPALHRSTTLYFGLAGALLLMGTPILGASLSIALYLLATLTILNPRRYLVNIAVSIAVPAAFRLLFDIWLGTPLPEGVIFYPR
jgi:putative tricarboxylic transport membrane protein